MDEFNLLCGSIRVFEIGKCVCVCDVIVHFFFIKKNELKNRLSIISRVSLFFFLSLSKDVWYSSSFCDLGWYIKEHKKKHIRGGGRGGECFIICCVSHLFFYNQQVSSQESFFTFLAILGSYTKRLYFTDNIPFLFALSSHCSSHIWSQNISNKFSLDSFCLDADTNLVNKKQAILSTSQHNLFGQRLSIYLFHIAWKLTMSR